MNQTTAVERVDLNLAERAAPVRRNPIVRAVGWVSELADQPPLISICVATTLIGAIAHNPRMTRAGDPTRGRRRRPRLYDGSRG
jgi:hypothetical protein